MQRKVEQKVDAKIKVLKDLFDKKIKVWEAQHWDEIMHCCAVAARPPGG